MTFAALEPTNSNDKTLADLTSYKVITDKSIFRNYNYFSTTDIRRTNEGNILFSATTFSTEQTLAVNAKSLAFVQTASNTNSNGGVGITISGLDEPFIIDQTDWENVNSEDGQQYLFRIREKFKNLEKFSLENIENLMREELKDMEIKPKVGFQITRVSITGTKISPPLFESIFALGKEGTLARLAETIEKL